MGLKIQLFMYITRMSKSYETKFKELFCLYEGVSYNVCIVANGLHHVVTECGFNMEGAFK